MADYTRFKLRGDVKADWLNANPVLALNEPALETDTKRFKIGDGVSTYSALPYGRNTNEYASLYNVSMLFPLSSGFYAHTTAITSIPTAERIKGLIISYETSAGTWYTEQYTGTDVSGWATLANWSKVPGASDFSAIEAELAQLESDLNETNLDIQSVKSGNLNDSVIGLDKLTTEAKAFIGAGGEVTNLADGEDLENVEIGGISVVRENTIKVYDAPSYSGLGRVILRKNMVGGVNVLTQEMISQANTIYEIRYDFDTQGAILYLGENCSIKLNGGTINGGEVHGFTKIEGDIKRSTCNFVSLSNINSVSYQEFGAKLNGVDDDYLYIKECHEYANKYGLDVIQRIGTIYIHGEHNDPIIIQTNTDISGCTLVMDDTCVGHNIYNIAEDEDNQLENVTDVVQSDLFIGANEIPSLSTYKESFFICTGERTIGIRPPDTVYKSKECFTILSDGVLMDGKLYCDYTVNDFNLLVKKINTKSIKVRLPRLYINFTSVESNFSKYFIVTRNNTILYLYEEIKYTPLFPTTGDNTNATSLTSISGAFGVKIIGGTGENKGKLPNEELSRTSYIFNISLSSFIEIKNITFYRGWGLMNTEFIKEIKVYNSIINRFDNHFGISNLVIEDCTIVGNNNCINIGYGNGNIYINRIKWIIAKTSSDTAYSLAQFREDIRLSYQGNVNISNISIDAQSSITNVISLLSLYDSYGYSNETYISSNKVNNISFDNIILENNSIKIIFLDTSFSELYSLPLYINSISFKNIKAGITQSIKCNHPNFLSIKELSLEKVEVATMTTTVDTPCIEKVFVKSCNSGNNPFFSGLLVSDLYECYDTTTFMYDNIDGNTLFSKYYNCLLNGGVTSTGIYTQFKVKQTTIICCTFLKNIVASSTSIVISVEGSEKSILFGNKSEYKCLTEYQQNLISQYVGSFYGALHEGDSNSMPSINSAEQLIAKSFYEYFDITRGSFYKYANGRWHRNAKASNGIWVLSTDETLIGSQCIYAKSDLVVMLSGNLNFAAINTPIVRVMPFVAQYGSEYLVGKLILKITGGSSNIKIASTEIGQFDFNISYISN